MWKCFEFWTCKTVRQSWWGHVSSAVKLRAQMTVATGLDFMALGLRVNQPVKTCCCGIQMGEALVRTLMVVDSRVFTSGSAFSRADCFLASPTFATSVMERFLWRLWVFFLSKMCEQLRQPAAWQWRCPLPGPSRVWSTSAEGGCLCCPG